MKVESIENIKQSMVSTYRRIGDARALGIKGIGKVSYTGNEIANEIENETELGIKMINNMIQLTIDLLKRNKINMSVDNLNSSNAYETVYPKASKFMVNADEKLQKIIDKLTDEEWETLRDRFADFYVHCL